MNDSTGCLTISLKALTPDRRYTTDMIVCIHRKPKSILERHINDIKWR